MNTTDLFPGQRIIFTVRLFKMPDKVCTGTYLGQATYGYPYRVSKIQVDNPEKHWVTKEGPDKTKYILIAEEFLTNISILGPPLTKQDIIHNRIKKLWNDSNYVRKYNAMRML